MAISIKASENLERIKKNISTAYKYMKPNYDRYHEFRKFVFKTSLSEDQKNILMGLKKPIIEFNILEAYISRLLGEFSKHEPSIEVTPSDGFPVDSETLKLVEGHIRHIIYEANKNSCSYEVYKDLLSGGFSALKVWTEYASPMSFNQVIKVERAFDPTLCGFDPMARFSHKSDGRFCFELFPKSKEDFEVEYPDVNLTKCTFSRKFEEFNWAYQNAKEDIVLLADYYEKKKKKTKIVKLANGRTMTDRKYQEYQAYWQDQQFIEQIPAVVGKPRTTELETVCRYVLIETEIIDYTETDYTYLPHVFVDGSSILLRDESQEAQQVTRPYVFHAKGIQSLKNFAGQTLANELENMVQHKFMVAKESIPQEPQYQAAYGNMQQADTFVYQAYNENMPDQPVPPPREINRAAIPQEVTNTFTISDQTTQAILGSFDAALGINDNQLSGVAIVEGATQSNAAAMPYVLGYLQAWSHVGVMVADLLPKYVKTPRTIPIVGMDGERQFVQVNGKGQPTFDYDENCINVNLEAGTNFQIQKNQALQQIIAMMQASEVFAQFMNTDGLPILLENLTIHGADQLAELAKVWQKKQQQQAQQQQQQQMQMLQMDPSFIMAQTAKAKAQQDGQVAMMKLQQEDKQNQFDNQISIAEVAIKKQAEDSKAIVAQQQVTQAQVESAVQMDKAQTEKEVHALDAAATIAKAHHDMKMDHHDSIRQSASMLHDMKQAEKEVNQPTSMEK